MAVNFYLDMRRPTKDGTGRLKLSVTKGGRMAYIDLNVTLRPDQWDGLKVTRHPHKAMLNDVITRRRAEADTALLQLKTDARWRTLTVYDVRDILDGRHAPDPSLFAERFRAFMESKPNAGTRGVYLQTLRHLERFDPDLDTLSFSDIDIRWLTAFDAHLARTCPSRNARNIHLRNIRAVFNAAIDDGITTLYPFRKFKIRPEATRHRALTPEQLRTLFSWPAEEWARIHLDMFRLTFFLMGINMVDLFNLESITPDGRIEYRRAKTGRLYSVKVEPEAMEIINRYRGKRKLLSIADNYASHQDYLHHLNAALKSIGNVTYGKQGRKEVEPLFPELSSYWARHSWATTAARLDIPKETIAAGLGHGGNTVTDIYIDFDRAKVDRANRHVIDFILYGRE